MNLFSGLIAEGQRCDHEWEYHQDTIGDYGVINGTYTECWMECSICGETREATDADFPDYDDFYEGEMHDYQDE